MHPPPASAPARIVLQTGATSAIGELFAIVFSFAAVVSALLLWGLDAADAMPFPHNVVLPLVPLLFAGAVVMFHGFAWRSRASDLRVDGEGLAVEGGPMDGTRYSWAQIDLDRTRIEENRNTTYTENGRVTYERKLVLGLAGRGEVALGASLDDDEQVSFDAVLAALRSLASPPSTAVAAPSGPQLLRCPACSAPVSPTADEAAACWRCDTPVPMPAELRERVAAAARLDAGRPALEAAVRRIRDQPGARAVNRLLLTLAAAKYALPLLLLLAPRLWVATLGGLWALSRFARLQVATRRAYPRLTWEFGAHPPAAPGAPATCRSCGGALPPPRPGAAVERCPWCDADNVLGVDLTPALGAAADEAADLEGFLGEQAARRAWPVFQLAVALAVTAFGVVRALLAAVG